MASIPDSSQRITSDRVLRASKDDLASIFPVAGLILTQAVFHHSLKRVFYFTEITHRKAQLENERARSTEIEERVIELEQILFERDRDTNKIQSEVDMLQAKLNASEESRCRT